MKTSKKISIINGKNRIILSFSLIALFIFISSIIFHVTPFKMLTVVSDFAVHHYFLSGFFALLVFSIGFKMYISNTSTINELRNEKKVLRDLKIKNRRIRIQRFRNNITLKLLAVKSKIISKNRAVISKYGSTDVLASNEQILMRQEDLKHAMRLGNSFRQNVKLYYKESNLHKCIETVILFVSNDHVTVRGGDVLPVKSIYKVEI